ncbi:sugar ABC transporter substrate-binding protein [Frondihabitans sp. PAMC 28766]|uniref:sugar ABC transporter substrate-binding protein n=1 Tax=Frondihabitans sp. PAMC 28766 TaxID=1795630 RepID=UPI00078DD046|nr:sugar ABC transporter substrate-binding protein [Frondihabitans sp. PAMC 28766]AMM19146.1 sugar ABC transporter substrate-binding protein [Frondihabitans sp. PAMC 28766]
MKKPRLIAAVAAAALIPLALAGCSSGGSSSSGGKVSLNLEDYYTAPQAAVMDSVYQGCASQLGIKVSSTHVPGAGLISKVLQQASSKTLPDVLMLDNPDVQQIAQSGALSPLSDYGITGKGFAPGVVKAGTYDGKLYGLAPAVNSIALFYNTDMFAKAGITTPPKTWDELSADATKLTSGSTYGFALSAAPTYEGTWGVLPFMWSNGGSEKNIDTPQTAQAIGFLASLVKDGSMSKSSVNWTQGDALNQFTAGKAAMMINGPWNLAALAKYPSIKWASVPIPTRVAGQTVVSPLGGETFNVPQTGNKTTMAAAGKLVKCITDSKNQVKIANGEGDVPASLATAATVAASNKQIAPFATIVKTARARTGLLGPKWPAAATKIYTAEQLALTGKATAAAAVKQAQNQQ